MKSKSLAWALTLDAVTEGVVLLLLLLLFFALEVYGRQPIEPLVGKG